MKKSKCLIEKKIGQWVEWRISICWDLFQVPTLSEQLAHPSVDLQLKQITALFQGCGVKKEGSQVTSWKDSLA